MRLIDADKLKEEWSDDICSFYDYTHFHFLESINNAQTVDAEPVRHGYWRGETDGYVDGELTYDTWHCSECDYCIDEGIDDVELLPNYCPNCGAKMDCEG